MEASSGQRRANVNAGAGTCRAHRCRSEPVAGFVRVIALVCLSGACDAPAAAEIATPAPVPMPMPMPAPKAVVTDASPAIGALPPSRQPTTRMPESRVRIEVRPHPSRTDSATVAIGEGLIDDIRSPAGKLLLSRWIDAKFMGPGIGMDAKPAGFVVAASTEIDTDVLLELLALAAGGNFDGPVELALRRGTEVTTIPIALGEKGIVPVPGKWGEWARELDDAWLATTGDTPLVLDLGDVVADAYRYAKARPRIDGLTRIAKIETSGALEPSLARRLVHAHRNEISSCYVQALVVRPSLAGTWKVRAAIAPDGRPRAPTFDGTADDRLQPCVAAALQRWKFPKTRGETVVAFAVELTPQG